MYSFAGSSKTGRYEKVQSKIQELTKNGIRKSTTIKDAKGNLLKDKREVGNRWIEYTEEQYDKDNRQTDIE